MNLLPGACFDVRLLKNPPADCEVTYSWLWNNPVTRELVDKGIKDAIEAGIKSLYVIPLPKDFRPETMRTFLDPGYLTDEFFDIINYAVRECVRHGMKPWLYDEGGWPSGSACGRTVMEYPEARTKLLKSRELTLKAGERAVSGEGFIAFFDGKERLPDDYVAASDMTVTEYYAGLDEVSPHFLDYTDPKMTEVFLSNTYEPYKRTLGDLFGDSIPLFFTDEPGIKRDFLMKDIFVKFKERFGYDLRDYIYVVSGDGALAVTEEEKRARIDYGRLRGDLFYENTFKKISEWCESNGIAYSGHIMADNYPNGGERCGYYSMLRVLRSFGIPGVDVIWEQIRYPYGGRAPVDEEETAKMPFFPRIAPSAARQTGRNLALTESLGIYGDGVTPDEMRYVANYQIVRGINIYSQYHLPIDNTRYSALATRPNFRPEKPGFYNLRHINEYIARLCYLARLGYAEGDTALYHQSADYFAGPEVSDAASESFKALGCELEDRCVPFDLIDDFGILDATDTGEGLKLGDALYRHIALPESKYIPSEVYEKIKPYIGIGEPTYRFKTAGLRVMTRRLDSGRLWFIFNEREETARESLDISDGKKVYRIDLVNGTMSLDCGAELELRCGDMAVFLVTDVDYPTLDLECEYSTELSELTPTGYKRFVVGFDRLSNEYGEGEPDADLHFSGEISYKGKYTLKDEPRCGEYYKLRLEGFSLTASVDVGGEHLTFGMSPMERIIDGSLLKKEGELTVTVANTSLNEIRAKEELMNHLPAAERGPYITRLAVHEERTPPLTLGRVTIEKMRKK